MKVLFLECEGSRSTLPLSAIIVPGELEERIREAVTRCAATLGESPERCRRSVEIAILQRGIEALEESSGS